MSSSKYSLIHNDAIVISGVAGEFPKCDNVKEFAEKLFAKQDLVTDIQECPKALGLLNDINRFDSLFFGIRSDYTSSMDSGGRKLLEKSYEAILDAGINPTELKGRKIGVFVAVCDIDSECDVSQRLDNIELSFNNNLRCMLANRLSFFLDVKGPSLVIDTGCSSSFHALHEARQAIINDECESAIVAACNMCRKTDTSYQFLNMGTLNTSNFRCRSFDHRADGYVRSEAVCVIFLQKSSTARRVYAEVVNTRNNNNGFSDNGITYPSGNMQRQLVDELYAECNVDKKLVSWIEAHGTGTKIGDPEELFCFETFCQDRPDTLYVGSVKSNMGHAEGASGLCSLIKVIIAMEHSAIPPNINIELPHPELKAIADGRIKVINETLPWEGGFVGVHSTGIGGSNSHVLLKSNQSVKRKKKHSNEKFSGHRLVVVSGRTKDAVNEICECIQSISPNDDEFVALIHGIFRTEIKQHPYRGYTLQGTNITDVEHTSGKKPPLWFIFSGIGSQWAPMAASLMKIPVFENAIQTCHNVLLTKKYDLKSVLLSKDASVYNRLLNSFIGITAMQIALTNVLKAVDVIPDGIIGHSMGELAAAYCDGCLTLEECILNSYYWSVYTSAEANLVQGLMFSVGLSYDELKKRCPTEVDIACRNSARSYVVSGPAEIMKQFESELIADGISVKLIYTEQVACHSRYVENAAGSQLLDCLRKVIRNPKRRSDKWISSVILKKDNRFEDVDGDLAAFASAEYFVKNLTSCVNFEEAASRIPHNAVTLEISADGILTSVLKQFPGKYFQASLSTMNSNYPDNYDYLHTTLGKLYTKGINMKLENLYPAVEFPVSKGTPMIAPLIRWNHSVKWPTPCVENGKSHVTADRCFHISLGAENYRFLKDHVVDGRNIFPGCGYLVLVWKAFASLYGKRIDELSVSFRDVCFKKFLGFQSDSVVPLNVTIHRSTGLFEFSDGREDLCTGYIRTLNEHHDESKSFRILRELHPVTVNAENQILKTADIYKELNLFGLKYGPHFQNIASCNLEGTEHTVKWNGNWIQFLDAILQCCIQCCILQLNRTLFVPEYIEKIIIDTEKHAEIINENANEIPVNVSSVQRLIVSPCVIVKNLKCASMIRRKFRKQPIVQKLEFIPYILDFQVMTPLISVLHMLMNLIYDSLVSINIKITEFITEQDSKSGKLPISLALSEISKTVVYLISSDIYVNDPNYVKEQQQSDNVNVHLVNRFSDFPSNLNSLINVVSYVSRQQRILEIAYDNTRENGFIILRERSTFKMPKMNNLQICCDYAVEDGDRILLLRKVNEKHQETCFFRIRNDLNFDWVTDLQEFVKINSENRIVLLVEDEPSSGILGFYKCLRKEVVGHNVRCIFVMDDTSILPKCRKSFYEEQLRSDLAINVYKDGRWGCYQFLTLDPTTIKIPVQHWYLSVQTRGDFKTLTWLEGRIKLSDSENSLKDLQNVIHIHYTAINFRDILLASGLMITPETATDIAGRSMIGVEFSGKLSNGQRVFGINLHSSMSNMLAITETTHLMEVPENWSLEDAATIGCAYVTVVYGLITMAKVQQGESVLIHGGAGGVGLAAINVAIYYKCNIYTTVSNEAKKLYLKQTFPSLEDSHIIVHENDSLERVIMDQTDGKGIDIVLNFYSGHMREESARCLTDYGRFIEIGKVKITDILTGFRNYRDQLSYHNIMADQMLTDGKIMKNCLELMKRGIQNGMIKPLKRTVFEADEVEQAFRYMSTGKHTGKILIRMRPKETEHDERPQIQMRESIPQFLCNDNGSVIVCGGLGGMALELCNWLINRGVRNLVLTSRYGIKTGYQKLCLHRWQTIGTNVVISLADLTTKSGVEQMIREASNLGPVLAIFNLTMVLRNGQFMNQTKENFQTTVGSKATGTALLDSISRRMCPYLRYFVVFSSVSCGYGSTGQTNYGLANSVMERICEQRKRDGLHALAVEWGPVADVGVLANLTEDDSYQGMTSQPIRSCYALLDYFLHQSNPTVVSMSADDGIISKYSDNTAASVICNLLGVKDLDPINRNTKLSELGLDSIATAEVKQMLEQNCNVYLSNKEIISLTITNILALSNV